MVRAERAPATQMARSIRTLLADDNPSFLQAARRFLRTSPVEVVGEAQTGRATLELLEALAPELLLLDLELPELDGLTVLRQAKARARAPRVIVVTLHEQDAYRAAAIEAGADGFVAKRELTTTLLPLIRQLFDEAG